MEVVGAIGFASGCIGFLVGTLPTLVARGHDILGFKARLEAHHLDLVTCYAKMKAWELTWGSDNTYPEDIYRGLWAESYGDISSGLNEIRILSQKIAKTIYTGDKNLTLDDDNMDLAAWKQMLSTSERRNPGIVKRIVTGVIKNQTLSERIGRLKRIVDNVVELSQRALQHHTGAFASDARDTLVRLQQFTDGLTRLANNLYHFCAASLTTSEWSLELRPPDEFNSIKNWDHLAQVDINFAFVFARPAAALEERRLTVTYTRQNVPRVVDWYRALLAQPTQVSDQPRNITVLVQQQPSRRSRPFRDLFKAGVFNGRYVCQAWEQDRAQLMLALSNWVLLLWRSDWTLNLCCGGLRFVQPAQGTDTPTHTYTISFAPNEHAQCQHHAWKLKNFGLVLAEIMLVTPIRPASADGQTEYERWASEKQTWEPITREELLGDVYRRSKSASMRDAVKFCLDERSPLGSGPFTSGFMLRYIDSIFEP
jgi:hypothetical protein